MKESKTINLIKGLYTSLSKESVTFDKIKLQIDEIYKQFQVLTGISGFDQKIEYLAAVPTEKGKALGLNYAAQCLLDYKRTAKFLKATVLAIKKKLEEQPNKPIHIFYVGCGPYAPFITLIAPLFSTNQIKFSILEVNESSLNSAKKLITSLNLSKHVETFYLGDALTFKVQASNTYDIIISETLDALLFRECYVPILNNLLPQLQNDITVIPENVILKLSANHKPEVKTPESFKVIFNTRKALQENNYQKNTIQFKEEIVDLSLFNFENSKQIIIDTEVHIYDDIYLTRNESSLTLPALIDLEDTQLNNKMSFVYLLEPEIGLQFKLKP